jgi:hypothetical protein
VVAVIASPPPGLSTDDSPAQQANVNTDAIATGPLTLNGHTFPLQLLPSTSCTIGGDSAIGRPALRLATFLSSYSKDHGRFYNVCQADYSAALADISEEVAANLSPCLPTGVQIPPNCTVVDVQNRGTAAQTEELVPPCGGGDGTCWSADQNAAACPASTSGWEVKITRSAPPPDGTITEVACAIAVQ